MLGALDTSTSALIAQRTRLDTIAGNIANAFVTRQEDGTPVPYRRRIVTFAAGAADEAGAPTGNPGVRVSSVESDPSAFRLVHDPGHPDRIRDGRLKDMVQYPNVNIPKEYVDAIEASRAYEANVAMMNVTKDMIRQALRLFA